MSAKLTTEGPHFVPPYRPDKGGVDFLGLRQVNLDMMAQCLPGINNVTRYIRPFSVVSWIYWKFYQLSGERSAGTVTNEELKVWQEKVETLFTWGHKLNGVSVPGSRDAKPPSEGAVPLDFAAWKRTAQNTSLMAAVTYGPPAKTIDGLGFLKPIEGGFFRTVGDGVELAERLNQNLFRFNLLKTLTPASAGPEQAEALFNRWSILDPSKGEKRTFRRALFDSSTIGANSALGRRSATIQLALDVLQRSGKPLLTNTIRSLMFRGISASKSGLGFNDPRLKPNWLRWIALQTRQAQRLAMENLMRWFELLLSQGYRDSEQVVRQTLKVIKENEFIFSPSKPRQSLALFQHKFRSLNHAVKSAGDLNLFWLIDQMLEAIDVSSEQLAPYSLRTLFLCAALTQLLDQHGPARGEIQRGHSERISLAFWTSTVDRCGDYELRDFLRFLFETMILSQHFAVAARRFDGGTQRLRISIEEDGLEFLADKVLVPSVTADRLESALSLMADCGMIGSNDERTVYFAS